MAMVPPAATLTLGRHFLSGPAAPWVLGAVAGMKRAKGQPEDPSPLWACATQRYAREVTQLSFIFKFEKTLVKLPEGIRWGIHRPWATWASPDPASL